MVDSIFKIEISKVELDQNNNRGDSDKDEDFSSEDEGNSSSVVSDVDPNETSSDEEMNH